MANNDWMQHLCVRTHLTRMLLLAVLLFNGPSTAQTRERVALVIGNATYPSAALPNPRRDADSMAELLARAGFLVDKRLDTDLLQLQAAVDQFGRAIRDPKVKFGVFYYAGHGLQQEWRNYLVPVSASIRAAADVPTQTVDVSMLLRHMEQAQGRNFLVILDACRDDPFAGAFKPPAKGLSQFDAPVGSLLAFATAPGNVAQDGVDGQNGLYTGFLLREFAVAGARLEDAFKRVRLSVRLASKGAQIPWESTSLEEDVYLFPLRSPALTEAEKDQLLEREMASWLAAKGNPNPEVLAAFIREYPSGNASELAHARLNRLLAAIKTQNEQNARDERARLAQAEAARLAAAAHQHQLLAQAAQTELQRLQLLQAQNEAITRARAELARAAQEAQAAKAAGGPPATDATVFDPTPYFTGYAEHRRLFRLGDEISIRVIDQSTHASKPLVMKVTQVDENSERVIYNNGEFVSDLMGNTTSNQRGVFSTPRQFYPADLIVGKKWRTRFKQSRPNGLTYTYQYDVKVVGREVISVPAGTFNAFKIEARGFNVELGAYLERNIWVAPGVIADIAHEIKVRLRSGTIEQNDRQELVSLVQARR